MEWFKVKSEKNQDLLAVDNYINRIDRKRGDNEHYKCVDNCGSRAIFKHCNYIQVT